MGFIRVRASKGAAHEFDISEAAYARDKRAYKVLDREPVHSPRPVKYIDAGKPAETAPAVAGGKE